MRQGRREGINRTEEGMGRSLLSCSSLSLVRPRTSHPALHSSPLLLSRFLLDSAFSQAVLEHLVTPLVRLPHSFPSPLSHGSISPTTPAQTYPLTSRHPHHAHRLDLARRRNHHLRTRLLPKLLHPPTASAAVYVLLPPLDFD